MKLLQVDQSRGGGTTPHPTDTTESPHPSARPTSPSAPTTSPPTTPTLDARETEARHSDASAALSGAGRALTGVTGRGTAPGSGPSADSREQFRQELDRFESLRRASPLEALRLLPNLRRLAGEIRENPRSTAADMSEDLLMLHRFYRSALDFLNAHRPSDAPLPFEVQMMGGDPHAAIDTFNTQVRELQGDLNAVNGAIGTLRTWLRSSLVVPSGGWATADQRAAARIVIEISRGLGEPAEVIADYRRHLQLINNTSGRDLEGRARVEELARDVRELFELRSHGLDGQQLSSIQQDQISTLMRDYAVEIHNSASYIETPRAQESIDFLLREVIDSNDGELVLRLSGEGLEAFARGEADRAGPHLEFEYQVRSLERRIQDIHSSPDAPSVQGSLHEILREIHQLESHIDSAHVVEDQFALRGLYQQLSELSEIPAVRHQAEYAEVRPGLERLTASLRATREIFRGALTGDYPVQDRVHMAQLAIQVSRGFGETGELIADYRRYLTVLNNTSSRDLEGAARVDAYAGFIRDLVDLRTNGLNQQVLTSAEESQVNSLMRDAATEIHNSLGYMETPHAHESIDGLLNRVIDADDQASVPRLTAQGLQEYAEGMRRAGEVLTRARGLENPAERRTALAEALRQFVALGASEQIHEVTELILNSVPADASEASRLQVYTVLSAILHGSGHPDEARIRHLGQAVAQRLMAIEIEVEHVEGDVVDGPGHMSRPVATSRTMVNPRGHIETAERLLAARSFFAAIGENATARRTEERLGELQDSMSTQIQTTTDHRLRIELASAIVSLDQTLADGQIATAEDADDRHEVGTRIRGHLQQWQNEVQGARGLPADFRLDQVRSILAVAAAYRPLTQGDRAALNSSELDGINTWASGQLTSVAQTTMDAYVQAQHLDPQLTPRVVEDFRARVDRAVREGDGAWLNGLNERAIGQFTEFSQSAHVLLQGQHQPRTAEDLQHCLEASAIFGRLGLPERVRECLSPVISHGDGLRDPSSRAHLYFDLGQIYQEAGMTEDANEMLERVRDLSSPRAPREIRQLAEVVPAMQELNLGRLDRARELLREIHGNPRAEGLLSSIEGGLRRRRALQSVDIARAVISDYAAAQRDRGSTPNEREMTAVFERAQRLVLSGRYGSIWEAMRHMDISVLNNLFHESSAGSHLRQFLLESADVSLTDDVFSERAYGLARRLFNEQRFQSSGQIASLLTGTPHVRAWAQSLIDAIPAEARWQSIFSITNVPIVGSILLNTGGDRAVGMGFLRDVATLATFGFARGLAVGAEAMFTAYVTETAVASSLMLRTAGFLIRAGTEAAAFTLSNMAFETLFTGRTDHWSLRNFGRQFGSMLVTFAFCHGISLAVSGAGRMAARTSWMGMAAEGVEGGTTRVLTPGAQVAFGALGYGATITGLVGVEYLNEALGLRPHEGDVPFVTRLLGSALMDAQMRLSGHLVNVATGGAIEHMEQTTQQRYLINELMPVVERMGFGRPERMSDMSPETRIVLQTLMARVAAGQSVSSLSEQARSSEADLSRTVQMICDVPPESPEGRRLRALLFAYSEARGSDFAVGSERLSEEVGRLRMEMGRTLRGLGVAEGPEFNRLQGALLERVLGARVSDGNGRPRTFHVADAEALTRQTAQIRGPLEGVVREVIGRTGLESPEGRALVGDLYIWMLETGGTIAEARTEAIRRLVVEASRREGTAPASISGAGLEGALSGMVRGASDVVRGMSRDFGVDEGMFASHSLPERAIRPLLEQLFNNPDSPPTAQNIRARLAEIRSVLEAANARISETIPESLQPELREEIFVEVLNGRMTRDQALARIAGAVPDLTAHARPEPPPVPAAARRGAAVPPPLPMAARSGTDVVAPRLPTPPPIPDAFAASDGSRYTVSSTEVSDGSALNPGEVAFRGPNDLANQHSDRSTPETRRRLAAAMAFANQQDIPRGERRFILTEDNHVLLEFERGGTRRRVRLTEEIPDLTEHARPEPPVIPDEGRRSGSGREVAGVGLPPEPVRPPHRDASPPPPQGGVSVPVIPRAPRVPDVARLDAEGAAVVHLMNVTGQVEATQALGFMGNLASRLEEGSPQARALAQRIREDIRAVREERPGHDEAAARLSDIANSWDHVSRGSGDLGRPRDPSIMDAPLRDALVVRIEGAERGTVRPTRERRLPQAPSLPMAAADGSPSTQRPEGREVTGVGRPPMAPTQTPELFGLAVGTEPQFLGYGIPQRMQEGLFRLITPQEETPFVNFAEEGLRVALEGRNARRAVPGFADFGHIIDRHAHASTARGDLRAGIYGEGIDLETVGRETVRGWDQATISFDSQGRQIFILRRTYDAEIGVDSAGRPTRVNQVIVSRDGEIVSSFPVPAEARGFVPRSEVTGEASFRDRLVQTSASREVSERHAPFLSTSSNADRNHLYSSDTVPFGLVNQRTLATFRDSQSPEYAGQPTTAQAGRPYDLGDGTTVIDRRGNRARVLVAEMHFEDPIGVRETTGPDGSIEHTPLRWNRTYFIEREVTSRDGTVRTERTILGGYPIADPSEPHLADTIWNPLARPQPEAVRQARAQGGRGEGRRGGRAAETPRAPQAPREQPLPQAAGEGDTQSPTVRRPATEPLSGTRAAELRVPVRDALAAHLHEAWREPRRLSNESGQPTDRFEPRWKRVRDADWIARHRDSGAPNVRIENGEVQVDIANTRYEDLPSDWQYENQASAETAVDQVLRAAQEGTSLDDAFIERASAVVHERWLERNREWAPPEQNRPYEQLSEPEREKDRVIVREAIRVYRERSVESAAPMAEPTHETTGVGPYPRRPIQGGAGGQDLGTMAFASPTPNVYTCTIGRGASSTEGFLGVVDSPHTSTISRRHAEVRIEGGHAWLSDLGGPNGTRVWDGTTRQWRRLTSGERYDLQSGETFQLGAVTFFIEREREGNYRLRVHGEDRPIAAAPFTPGGSVPQSPSTPQPVVRVMSVSGREGMMLPAEMAGDPFVELRGLPLGTEVFVAERDGRLVVERTETAESLLALRLDARGHYRIRGSRRAPADLIILRPGEGGPRAEPVAGRTGSVLQPGESRLGVGSYIINFILPGGESPRGGGAAGSAAPLPAQGPIGRGTWSLDLPDPPRGTTRPGIRLNDLAESAGFLDLYMGDPATHPTETEAGVAQLTLADPLDTGGGRTERRPLGRLERTTAGWVLHPPRAREVTISRPDRANPNGPSTEIRVRRESPERLREGDVISFGPALEFEFRNGSLIPAVTGDLQGRLSVPDRSAGGARDAMELARPPSVSLPPPAAEPVASPTIIDSSGRAMMVPLTRPGMLVLGRAGDLSIDAENPVSSVSTRHATVRLVVESGVSRYEIRDGAEIPTGWQASLNGTSVNGERVGSGEWRALREGDRIRIGTVDFTWHPPRTEASPVMHGTIAFAQWQQMNPELFQARQFLISHYLDGAPADRLEIPGRSAVFLEGAGRFVEGPESGGREIIVWDRNQDTVVNDFLRRVEGELQAHGLTRLDPSSPTFERDLQAALTYFVGRLRAEFRNPGEGSREADARLAAFVRAHPGERVLVGEMLRQRFPFCRHLTLVTQAFLTDMGLRGEAVRMQRGSAMGGAHVWNEVIVGRTRRIVEPTWAFYSDRSGPAEVLLPPGLEAIYTRETRGGRVE